MHHLALASTHTLLLLTETSRHLQLPFKMPIIAASQAQNTLLQCIYTRVLMHFAYCQVDFDMGPKRPPLYVPPHDGLGSEEDSLQNVLHLLPKPPPKPYTDYLENWVGALQGKEAG